MSDLQDNSVYDEDDTFDLGDNPSYDLNSLQMDIFSILKTVGGNDRATALKVIETIMPYINRAFDEQVAFREKIVTDLTDRGQIHMGLFETLPFGVIEVSVNPDRSLNFLPLNPDRLQDFQLGLGFQPYDSLNFCRFLHDQFKVHEDDTTQPRFIDLSHAFRDERGMLQHRTIRAFKMTQYIERRGVSIETIWLEDISHAMQKEQREAAFFKTFHEVAYIVGIDDDTMREMHIGQNRKTPLDLQLIGTNVRNFYEQRISPNTVLIYDQHKAEAIANNGHVVTHVHELPTGFYNVSMCTVNEGELMIYSVDVTELYRTFQEKYQAEEAFETIKAVIYGMGHDLRQPLTSISLGAKVIDRLANKIFKGMIEAGGDERLAAMESLRTGIFEKIIGASLNILGRVDWATRLTATLENFASLDKASVNLSQIDVNRFLKEFIGEWGIDDNKRMRVNFEGLALPAFIDHNLLGQVVQNLLTNALKYSSDEITIRTCTIKENSTFRIEVTDKGIGIAEDQKDKVWELFGRTEQAKMSPIAGRGIGLATVNRIVRHLLNGNVWFESELGKGTTFFVELPLNIPEA